MLQMRIWKCAPFLEQMASDTPYNCPCYYNKFKFTILVYANCDAFSNIMHADSIAYLWTVRSAMSNPFNVFYGLRLTLAISIWMGPAEMCARCESGDDGRNQVKTDILSVGTIVFSIASTGGEGGGGIVLQSGSVFGHVSMRPCVRLYSHWGI